jgi:hypothetical protein
VHGTKCSGTEQNVLVREPNVLACRIPPCVVYSQGDDSSPPPLCGLIFFEGDRCLCLTLKFVERLKCYSAKPNESCIIFGIYYFISCLISIVILSLCIFLFLLSFLVRYRVKTMQEKEKMCQTVA